jgi:hypothetical protein
VRTRWAVGIVLLLAVGAAVALWATADEEAEVVATTNRYVEALMSGDEAAASDVLCSGVSGVQLPDAFTGYVQQPAVVDGESASVTYRLGPFHQDGRWQTYRELELWLGETDSGWCIAETPRLRDS